MRSMRGLRLGAHLLGSVALTIGDTVVGDVERLDLPEPASDDPKKKAILVDSMAEANHAMRKAMAEMSKMCIPSQYDSVKEWKVAQKRLTRKKAARKGGRP